MRLVCALLIAAMTSSVCFADDSFPVSELQFKSIFAQRAGERTLYRILGTGFFRAPRAEGADEAIADWLRRHPDARATAVDTPAPPGSNGVPMVYVWIDDGAENLNLWLVREGFFTGGTMVDPVEYMAAIHHDTPSKRAVSDDRYAAFRKRLLEAEDLARREKKGIWSARYDQLREQERIK